MAREDSAAKTQNLGGAPEGNVNAMSCGAYSKRLFSEDEQRLFETMLSHLNLDFPSIDQSTLEEIAVCSVQLSRALDAGNDDAFERLNRKVRKLLKVLMAPTVNQDHTGCCITYDEWFESLSKAMKR